MNRTPAIGETEKATFSIGYINLNTTAYRFIHDYARIGIERIEGFQMRGEKLLIDCILAFYRKEWNAAELQLLIEPYGVFIVVQNREIDMTQATGLKMLSKFSYQLFTDARLSCLRMNCETPE